MCLCSRRFHDNRLWIHKDFRAKWGWEIGGVTPKEDKHNYRDRQAVRKQSNQLKQLFISNESQFFDWSKKKIVPVHKKSHFAFIHVRLFCSELFMTKQPHLHEPQLRSSTNELTQPSSQTPKINSQISIALWLRYAHICTVTSSCCTQLSSVFHKPLCTAQPAHVLKTSGCFG